MIDAHTLYSPTGQGDTCRPAPDGHRPSRVPVVARAPTAGSVHFNLCRHRSIAACGGASRDAAHKGVQPFERLTFERGPVTVGSTEAAFAFGR
eukprot:2691954-Prymnesium_polylepis.1